jgi:hypothetical protein
MATLRTTAIQSLALGLMGIAASLLAAACGGGAGSGDTPDAAAGAGTGGAGGTGATGGSAARSDGGTVSTVTSFQLSSATGGDRLPFTVGLAFHRGDVPAEFALDLPSAQIEVKRRWNDGSVKHAIVSGHVDLPAAQPKTIAIVSGAYAGGKALTCTDIQSAAPRASVTLGALGSVDLATLLAAPVRTWLSGPEVVECHYRGKVGADPTLRVQFQVRRYREGRTFIRAAVENGYLDVSTADKSYSPVVKIDDKVVYDGGAAAFTHRAHTRWFAEAWIGGDPQIIARHDVRALVGSLLLPNYQQKPAASAALDALYQVYKPGEHGDWTPEMGETGFQAQIGLLPNWDALYVTSDGDPRAVRATMANAKALSSYPIVWRDSTDDQVVRPSARPTWTVDGKDQGGETNVGAGPLVWDNAHHGSGGYLAYLLSGDYLFLETMQMQSSLAYLIISSAEGSGPARVLTGQTRAMAWANRTVGQYVAVAPLEPASEDYRALLAANAAHWKGMVQGLSDKHLGLVYSRELLAHDYGEGLLSPWQENFVTQAFGHVSDLEPLADMADWNTVRDYAYQFPVGLLGDAAGYCFTRASQYTLKVADTEVDSLGPTYASWAMVYASMFKGMPCGNTLLGDSGGAPDAAATGYWGNLMPAIALAVDHGAPGAAAAWARFTGADNYSTVKASPFESVPVWGVVPR